MAAESVSPKQAAKALGASESSLKRWCDDGRIPTLRTAGGHRRIPVSAVVEFARATGRILHRPESLGMCTSAQRGKLSLETAAGLLRDGLLAGDEEVCRGVLLELHWSGHRLAAIADHAIARAFQDIGATWACGEADVYQERRGCQICLRVLNEIRSLIPVPQALAPLAIGAAVGSDSYSLPTTLCELVLRQAGWDARSLGWTLPMDSVSVAVEAYRPRLCWISVSYFDGEQQFLEDYARFYQRCRNLTPIAVGGRALTPSLLERMQFTTFCDSMSRLDEFAQALGLSIAASAAGETSHTRGNSA